MTYILYAADPTQGTSTFKQHTFTSLKELTEWCIASAFDKKEATPYQSIPIESLRNKPEDTVDSTECSSVPEKRSQLEKILENIESIIQYEKPETKETILNATKQYLNGDITFSMFQSYAKLPEYSSYLHKIACIISSYDTTKCIEKIIPESAKLKKMREEYCEGDRLGSTVFEYIAGEIDSAKKTDISGKTDIQHYLLEDLPEDYWSSRKEIYNIVKYFSGYDKDDDKKTTTRFSDIEKYFTNVFFNDYFTEETNPIGYMSGPDMVFLLNLYFKNPSLYSGDLSTKSGVYWDRLPEQFREEACTLLSMKAGELNEVETLPHQLLAIYKFLQAGRYLSGWGDSLNITFDDLAWPDKMFAEKIVMKIADEYGTLQRPSSKIRTFFVKLYTIQRYTHGGTTTIGSTEFLDTYVADANLEEVSVSIYDYCFTTLPLHFRRWLAAATTHKDCKAALEDLGIKQVRRSEGQRYLDIQRVPIEPVFVEGPTSKTVPLAGKWKITGELEAYDGGGMAPFNI